MIAAFAAAPINCVQPRQHAAKHMGGTHLSREASLKHRVYMYTDRCTHHLLSTLHRGLLSKAH
jgi:hypothetical protein